MNMRFTQAYWRCEECGRGFDTYKGLSIHERRHRNGSDQDVGPNPSVIIGDVGPGAIVIVNSKFDPTQLKALLQQQPEAEPRKNQTTPYPSKRPRHPEDSDLSVIDFLDELPINDSSPNDFGSFYDNPNFKTPQKVRRWTPAAKVHPKELLQRIKDEAFVEALFHRSKLKGMFYRAAAFAEILRAMTEGGPQNSCYYRVLAFGEGEDFPEEFGECHRVVETHAYYDGNGEAKRPLQFSGDAIVQAGMEALYGVGGGKKGDLINKTQKPKILAIPCLTNTTKEFAQAVEFAVLKNKHLSSMANVINGYPPNDKVREWLTPENCREIFRYASIMSFAKFLTGKVLQVSIEMEIFQPPFYPEVQLFRQVLEKQEEKARSYLKNKTTAA